MFSPENVFTYYVLKETGIFNLIWTLGNIYKCQNIIWYSLNTYHFYVFMYWFKSNFKFKGGKLMVTNSSMMIKLTCRNGIYKDTVI